MDQLVRAEIRLERSGAVENAKAGRHAAEGAEDDEPGTQTALGEGVSISLVLWSDFFARYGPIGVDWTEWTCSVEVWHNSLLLS